MKINAIRVAQSVVLPEVNLTGLSPALNVILMPDARGTELVRFVRDILFGPDNGRPGPITAARRSGSVTIESSTESSTTLYDLACVERPGHPDTIAISARSCEPRSTGTLRARLDAADSSAIRQVCLVTAEDRDRVHELLALAQRLAGRPPLRADIELPQGPADRGVPASLAQQCERLRLEISSLARSTMRRQREFHALWRVFDDQQRAVAQEIAWYDAELQTAVNDVRQLEDCLWAPPAHSCGSDPVWTGTATKQLAGYVEHLQRVLCDLAERRLELSRSLALGTTVSAGPGDDRLEVDRSRTIRAENERLRIDRCEAELLHQLRCLELSRLADSEQRIDIDDPVPAARSPVDKESLRNHLQDALARSQALRQRLEALRRRQSALHSEWQRHDAERRRIAADRTLDARLYEYNVLEQEMTATQVAQQAASLLNSVRGRPRSLPQPVTTVLQRASAFLQQLAGTESRRELLQTDSAQPSTNDLQQRHQLESSLSPGEREAVALALRLALLSPALHGNLESPIVWDDPVTEIDPERLRAAGRLLVEFAGQGRQILVLTSRAYVAAILAESGAAVHTLPEPRVLDLELDVAVDRADGNVARETEPVAAPLVRVHPAQPHWLQADSPLNELPSLGPQMARQLRRMGLNDVGDLIALDLLKCTFLLSESRLTAEQVRLWQAEAELLCCVPDLTGRDAQLLVGCGLLTPADLATAKTDQLIARIDRLRGGEATRWLPYVGVWPRAETVGSWIHAARRAQSLVSVFAAAARTGRRPRQWTSRFDREVTHTVDIHSGIDPAPDPAAGPDLRLRVDSPVVDAPSIGQKTAQLLQRVGIVTIGDLLNCDAESSARRLHHPRITAEVLTTWQRQSALMCSIPGLRCGDVQVLVACGIHQAADLRRISASALSAIVVPFVESVEGRRLLRSATPPTVDDVARWVQASQDDGLSRAA